MPQPVELKGRPASPGVALGPIARLGSEIAARRAVSGNPDRERADLIAATEKAGEDLAALASSVNGEAAAILEFQIAMLEDDALTDPAFAEIEAGRSAAEAWRAALDAQIADYAAAEDDYFRAREADLRDMRDRVLRLLCGIEAEAVSAGAIMIGDDLAPTRFLETDWSAGGGILLTGGSAASHVAMLARSHGVPMVVGVAGVDAEDHHEALIDGARGTAVLSPGETERRRFAEASAVEAAKRAQEVEFLHRDAVTADGTRIAVMVNLASLDELSRVDPSTCDGVGLLRTEFLFGSGPDLPDEAAQYEAYRRFLDWAAGKPVTIRTLDAGGDKPIAGLTPEGETNSFLGVRGLRLSLARPDVFRVQLRALARAAVNGNLKVMFPMVTHPFEMARAVALFEGVLSQLDAEGIGCARPPLGMMVEVPAAAITPAAFRADFFSIGSNDLVQYVTATARDGGAAAELYEPAAPAVLKLIRGIAEDGWARGIEVSICGDMAGEPDHIPALLSAGLRTLSVAPPLVARTKAAVSGLTLGSG